MPPPQTATAAFGPPPPRCRPRLTGTAGDGESRLSSKPRRRKSVRISGDPRTVAALLHALQRLVPGGSKMEREVGMEPTGAWAGRRQSMGSRKRSSAPGTSPAFWPGRVARRRSGVRRRCRHGPCGGGLRGRQPRGRDTGRRGGEAAVERKVGVVATGAWASGGRAWDRGRGARLRGPRRSFGLDASLAIVSARGGAVGAVRAEAA